MISAIVLNWKRPFNLKSLILPRLAKHPLIDEIIVSHANPKTRFELSSPYCEIKHFDDSNHNATLGLALRFYHMLRAKNKMILLLDDDLIVSPASIHGLVECFQSAPHLIHGLEGRKLCNSLRYHTKTHYGQVPIVLTRCMLLHQRYAALFFEQAHHMNVMLSKGMPLWNGEDIFISMLCLRQTQQFPLAHQFAHINLRYSELCGISSFLRRWRNPTNALPHHLYRTQFVQSCIKSLDLSHYFVPEQQSCKKYS